MQQTTNIVAEEIVEQSTIAHQPFNRYTKPASAISQYRNEHLLNLSSVQVVQKLYDVAIQGCKQQNNQLAQKALTELIVSLNFDYPDVSVGLYDLYNYCKRCIRQGQVEEASRVLEELRTTWMQAFNLA